MVPSHSAHCVYCSLHCPPRPSLTPLSAHSTLCSLLSLLTPLSAHSTIRSLRPLLTPSLFQFAHTLYFLLSQPCAHSTLCALCSPLTPLSAHTPTTLSRTLSAAHSARSHLSPAVCSLPQTHVESYLHLLSAGDSENPGLPNRSHEGSTNVSTRLRGGGCSSSKPADPRDVRLVEGDGD